MSGHCGTDWKRVKELWDAGEPCKAIAREFGLSPSYISSIARTNGWKKRRTLYSEEKIQQVLDLYLGTPGASAKDVGAFVRPKLTKDQVLWIVRRYRFTWARRGSTHV